MNLRKILGTGVAAALFVSSTLHASATEALPNDYVKVLRENQKFIIDVEAYRAAYSDLEEALGDDLDAYVEHYLTIGVYEGRTKGVLFDPLAYAESYNDVKDAFGYNIPAIVNHYIKFGLAEKRTMGTADGFADIAAAERAGAQKVNIQRTSAALSNYGNSSVESTEEVYSTADNTDKKAVNVENMPVAGSDQILNSNMSAGNNKTAGIEPARDQITAGDNSAPAANRVTAGNSSSPAVSDTTADNSGIPMVSDVVGDSSNIPVDHNNAVADAGNDVNSNKGYHHTTSIYDNDEVTLLRVEYYDDNNKLIQYSSVSDFDSSTNSYTEQIYHYDKETESSVLDRTDTYVNGALSSSESN